MSAPLDTNVCRELANYVETLTHSGQKILNVELLKKVKTICRSSDGYVEHTYHLLRHQLEVEHAEVRYSAFQVIDELFRRSHCFRELMVSDLQRILELTTGTSSSNLLPPPKIAAKNLNQLSLRCIHEWNMKYGEAYKKLQLGYNFLKKCKKVDFITLEIENSAEQAQLQERLRRQNLLHEQKTKNILTEYNEMHSEMRNSATAISNCIKLLVPSLEEFFIAEDATEITDSFNSVEVDMNQENCDSDNSDEELNSNIRAHGMLNSNFSVNIEVNSAVKVKETPDNSAIFDNIRDLHQLIQNRYIPTVKRWMKVLTQYSGNSADLKKLVDLKDDLEKSITKCNSLNMCMSTSKESDSSDSEFEDVPEKEGYEETVYPQTSIMQESSSTCNRVSGRSERNWSISSKENNVQDPTTVLSTLETLKSGNASSVSQENESCSGSEEVAGKLINLVPTKQDEPMPSTSKEEPIQNRKQKLLSLAPKLPFDIDLYHWEDENLKAPTMLIVKPDGARFWSATSTDEMEEIVVPEGTASLRTRVIEFSGKHEPIKWTCRAPLSSGKLCPRRDRYKCPFHGRIVARDSTGKCSNPEDEMRLQKELEDEQQKCPDWQDPALLKEIEEATGLDLKIPEKGKRKKKKESTFPGLTDIKAKQNNTYTRLAKKVFNKKAVKRVAHYMDTADHKRFRDKFGDQFNYVHHTS